MALVSDSEPTMVTIVMTDVMVLMTIPVLEIILVGVSPEAVDSSGSSNQKLMAMAVVADVKAMVKAKATVTEDDVVTEIPDAIILLVLSRILDLPTMQKNAGNIWSSPGVLIVVRLDICVATPIVRLVAIILIPLSRYPR